MKTLKVFLTLYCLHFGLSAQIDPASLLGLNSGTTTEINAIVAPIQGSLVYNTTDKAVYQYNGLSWEIMGQTGPAGPAGPTGPQGIPGDPATDDQTLATDGTAGNISISGGNSITLDVRDGDDDSNNEIQTLSLVARDLTISGSGGNTVTLPVLINLATDNLMQDPETRIYDMNTQDLGFTNGNVGIGNATPNSTLQIAGSVSTAIRTTNVNTALGSSDFTLVTTDEDLIITLPAASACEGRIYVIKNYGGGDNNTNIPYLKGNGDPDTKIDNDKITWLQSDGLNWQLISRL